MATSETSMTTTGLVDLSTGVISREIFVNDDIYQQEQEQVFARSWLLVGHESQVPKPGDYFVSCMGEESVILCRDREGHIHAFLNSCRHRGMKVCRYDEGNTPVFTCPYHGWSYATDGQLVGVPFFKDAYHEELDKSQWGLVEVAQLANYKGSIWATWDASAPSFADYMGGMTFYLDHLLDARDGSEGGSDIDNIDGGAAGNGETDKDEKRRPESLAYIVLQQRVITRPASDPHFFKVSFLSSGLDSATGANSSFQSTPETRFSSPRLSARSSQSRRSTWGSANSPVLTGLSDAFFFAAVIIVLFNIELRELGSSIPNTMASRKNFKPLAGRENRYTALI